MTPQNKILLLRNAVKVLVHRLEKLRSARSDAARKCGTSYAGEADYRAINIGNAAIRESEPWS